MSNMAKTIQNTNAKTIEASLVEFKEIFTESHGAINEIMKTTSTSISENVRQVS